MPERIATPIEQAIHTPMLASELETLKQPETPIKALPEKEVIIWTPRFMVTFALLAVIWLSAGSLIAQGLQNHLPFLSPNSKILLVETTFVFGGWITLLFTSRNTWLRLGSICGGAWGVLSLLNFALRTFTPTWMMPSLPTLQPRPLLCCWAPMPASPSIAPPSNAGTAILSPCFLSSAPWSC